VHDTKEDQGDSTLVKEIGAQRNAMMVKKNSQDEFFLVSTQMHDCLTYLYALNLNLAVQLKKDFLVLTYRTQGLCAGHPKDTLV
jgi:hypothetical protein